MSTLDADINSVSIQLIDTHVDDNVTITNIHESSNTTMPLDSLNDLFFTLKTIETNSYDNKLERCILVAVDSKANRNSWDGEYAESFSFKESLKELQELVKTAGLCVRQICVQRLQNPMSQTYIGSGKVNDIMSLVEKYDAKTIVFDDDLTMKQQRNLEDLFSELKGGSDVKILDRTAIILEIFAQNAKSKEGQLQVELAMLEYRLTRGPKSSGNSEKDSGCGFRGPGETKIETDKRVIKDKIILVKKEIEKSQLQRQLSRNNRKSLGLPVVTLCGYTNAGKSTLMNLLSHTDLLAENKLFATLDPTTRKIRLPSSTNNNKINCDDNIVDVNSQITEITARKEVFLTDTVGFISKLPTSLIAAFRSTLEEVQYSDVLIHVIDRSNPIWRKHRVTVLKELKAIGCNDKIIIELWNKIDKLDNPNDIIFEAENLPLDIELINDEDDEDDNVELIDNEMQLLDDTSSISTSISTEVENIETATDLEKKIEVIEDDDDMPIGDINELSNDIKSNNLSKNSNNNNNSNITNLNSKFQKKTFIIAASIKKQLNLNKLYNLITDSVTMSQNLYSMKLYIPYNMDNGLVALIRSQGIIENIQYTNKGTKLIGKIPESLLSKVQSFEVITKPKKQNM